LWILKKYSRFYLVNVNSTSFIPEVTVFTKKFDVIK